MSNGIECRKLVDEFISYLTFQSGAIQIPVREARRGCHHNVMAWALVQATCQHAIHATKIVADQCKSLRVDMGLREKQVDGAADVHCFLNRVLQILHLCTLDEEISV